VSTGHIIPLAPKHNITPDRVVFVYNSNSAESLEVARYYAKVRYLSTSQLCPVNVPISNTITEGDLEIDLVWPLQSFMNSNFSSENYVYCIILGYELPTIFTNGSNKYSIASRLHRIGHVNDKKYPNFIYDRKTFKFFNQDDRAEGIVVSHITGPTKKDAINIINRSLEVSLQKYVTGDIVLDPYGKKITSDQLDYQQEILDLIQYDIDSFGLTHTSTVDIDDPYRDPVVPFLEKDSFYWGWFLDRVSPKAFKPTKTKRVFLYNADDDGGGDITNVSNPLNSDRWPNVSTVYGNYAAAAGSVDRPGEDALVYPRPFFESLYRGAGIGEAFFQANKFVEWKNFLVADPLMTVNFPTPFVENTKLPNKEIIFQTIFAVDNSVKYYDKLILNVNQLINNFIESSSFDAMDTFFANTQWRDRLANADSRNHNYGSIITSLVNYIKLTENQTIDEWLQSQNVQISQSMADVIAVNTLTTISSSQIYSDGYWQFAFYPEHSELTLENLNFVIQIAYDSDFQDILLEKQSTDTLNWFYEKEKYTYSSLPSTGFPSNYVGRRIMYSGTNDLLEKNSIYYVRAISDDSGPSFVSNTTEVIT